VSAGGRTASPRASSPLIASNPRRRPPPDCHSGGARRPRGEGVHGSTSRLRRPTHSYLQLQPLGFEQPAMGRSGALRSCEENRRSRYCAHVRQGRWSPVRWALKASPAPCQLVARAAQAMQHGTVQALVPWSRRSCRRGSPTAFPSGPACGECPEIAQAARPPETTCASRIYTRYRDSCRAVPRALRLRAHGQTVPLRDTSLFDHPVRESRRLPFEPAILGMSSIG
jgi:hypothetical protein